MGTKGYEITPFRAVLPGIPAPEGPLDPDRIREEQAIPVTGLRTEPVTLDGARRETEAMLWDCKRRVADGQYHALIELLDANPALVADAWVRETCLDLAKRKLLVRNRGRIRGKYQYHPLVVVGLVECLIAQGEVATPEKAFARLEELDLLRYETAKDLYYRARRQDRFRPILLEFPEFKRQISVEEGDALLRHARVLEAGKPINYRKHDPTVGEMEVSVRATE